MDNLFSAHKGERIKGMIEGRGCQLLYLPSYSPDLNPSEEAFSKIKRLVRKAGEGPGRSTEDPGRATRLPGL
jgi:transposase